MVQHNNSDIIEIFNNCFYLSHNTKLIKGGDEPIYIPANTETPYHSIYFAHGYYSSALHEIAHWLIAGEKRRLLEDFGYWYAPDGRTEAQQREFEKVEIKPQAIEWILADAAGFRYFASSDNLSGTPGDTQPFKNNVYQQVLHYIEHGLPERAEKLRQALATFYGTPARLSQQRFNVATI